MCATFYRCITGEILPEPTEIIKHGIVRPSQKGVRIPKKAENALLKGLKVNAAGRISDIQELIDAFDGVPSKQKYFKTAAIVAFALLVFGVMIKTKGFGIPEKIEKIKAAKTNDITEATITPNPTETPEATATPTPTEAPEPTVTPNPTETPEPTATPTPMVTPTATPEELAAIMESEIENMRNSDVGDEITYGVYEQDNNPDNGKETIAWRILAKEGNRILVISKYALACESYHTEYRSVTWESCTLRKWLNNEFLNEAFTEPEKSRIPTVSVAGDTNGGNNTQDQVFLFSIQDVNTYFNTDEDRQCEATEYAKAQGGWSRSENGKSSWWLLTPGSISHSVAYVDDDGSIYDVGEHINSEYVNVRPAMWIDLNS